jgi:DNA-binding PadR family transcriptional regulator
MFPDHSLMPKEALRLAALGMLAEQPMPYGHLAGALRDFVHHIMGPSPEAMGSSLELLRYEELVRPRETGDGGPVLELTPKGREEFVSLMLATVRTPFNDLNKLVVALKLRFLPLLPSDGQRDQTMLLIEACRVELARLLDLRARQADRQGPFLAWLDHDIAQAQARLSWFETLSADL